MELMLKVDLTEEQYNDLMTKSYHEIFESVAFKDALKDSILLGMENWLNSTEGKDVIRTSLCGDNYYDRNLRKTELGKSLLEVASSDFTDRMKEPVENFFREALRTVRIEDMLKYILVEAFKNGLISGSREVMEILESKQVFMQDQLDDIKNKLQSI